LFISLFIKSNAIREETGSNDFVLLRRKSNYSFNLKLPIKKGEIIRENEYDPLLLKHVNSVVQLSSHRFHSIVRGIIEIMKNIPVISNYNNSPFLKMKVSIV
jgi:hypothetical protein